MKSGSFFLKSTTIIAFILCFTLAAIGQTESDHSPETRSKKITDKMKTELSLTDEQTPKVEEINLKYAKKNDETAKSSAAKRQKFEAIKADNEAKSKELKTILTEEQYEKYKKMQKEMKAEMKEAYKKKKGS